jgi:hypothetical protein
MDAETIIAQLSRFKGLPREALLAAANDRASLAPRFIRIIEDYLALPVAERPVESPIFFIFSPARRLAREDRLSPAGAPAALAR